MRLTVREAAGLLAVSEQTINRWAAAARIPAFRMNGQYRFNRTQLLEWAIANHIEVSPDLFTDPDDASPVPSLAETLRAGGVFHEVAGDTAAAVLTTLVGLLPLPAGADRDYLLEMLLAREKLASTAIGDGIAIPHVRNPVVMHLDRPMLCVCFLARPVDYGALDGQPVHTLFTIISPTVREHLGLLSRLGFGLRDAGFAAAVRQRASGDELIAAAGRLTVPPGAGP
jgi:PTS system nitrogen regulatory IIA component